MVKCWWVNLCLDWCIFMAILQCRFKLNGKWGHKGKHKNLYKALWLHLYRHNHQRQIQDFAKGGMGAVTSAAGVNRLPGLTFPPPSLRLCTAARFFFLKSLNQVTVFPPLSSMQNDMLPPLPLPLSPADPGAGRRLQSCSCHAPVRLRMKQGSARDSSGDGSSGSSKIRKLKSRLPIRVAIAKERLNFARIKTLSTAVKLKCHHYKADTSRLIWLKPVSPTEKFFFLIWIDLVNVQLINGNFFKSVYKLIRKADNSAYFK